MLRKSFIALTNRPSDELRYMSHHIARAARALFSPAAVGSDPVGGRRAVEGRTFFGAFADAAIAIHSCRSSCRQNRAGRCRSCAKRCAGDGADGQARSQLPPTDSINSADRLRNRTQQLHLETCAPPVRNLPGRLRKLPKEEPAAGRPE